MVGPDGTQVPVLPSGRADKGMTNMCRIAAYLGPPVRLSALLGDPTHGLTDQSRNAKMMTDSSVAGDGWGVGWFQPEAGPSPGLLKSILPLWSDENGKT